MKRACAFLVDSRCARYAEILAQPLALWEMAPAFGAGCCCSPLNSDRAHALHYRRSTRGLDWFTQHTNQITSVFLGFACLLWLAACAVFFWNLLLRNII